MHLGQAMAVHRYALEHQRHRAPLTLANYKLYEDAFLAYLDEEVGPQASPLNDWQPGLDQLNVQRVTEAQRWVRSRSTGKRGGAVAEKQFVVVLKALSRFLWEQEYIAVDPLARLRVPRVPKIHKRGFTPDEAKRIVQAASAGPNPIRDRALILLMFDTGCRIGELCAAEMSDLDVQEGRITFRKTKNGQHRTVFFKVASRRDGGPCLSALKQWLKVRTARPGVGNIFTTREGFCLSTRRVREMFHDFGEQARVPDAHPHRTRHSAATAFLERRPGAELQLRSRLGHVSRDVLADYISWSDQSAQQAAEDASLSQRWEL